MPSAGTKQQPLRRVRLQRLDYRQAAAFCDGYEGGRLGGEALFVFMCVNLHARTQQSDIYSGSSWETGGGMVPWLWRGAVMGIMPDVLC